MSTDVLIASTAPPPESATHCVCDTVIDVVSESAFEAAGPTAASDQISTSFSDQLSDYVQLTKPRIVMMILITTSLSAVSAQSVVPVICWPVP